MKKAICWILIIPALVASPAVLNSFAFASETLPVIGVVQHMVLPPDRSKTFFLVIIGPGFKGMLPDGIDTITVEGPTGVYPLSKQDFRYVPGNREFWATLDGPPAEGNYKITVTADKVKGVVATSMTGIRKLPTPRALKVDTDEDGAVFKNRPVFSWESGKYAGSLFYQFQIKDSSGKNLYKSDLLPDATSHRLWENVLEPGRNYYWRIRVFDSRDWLSVRNRAQSNWTLIRTAASIKYEYIRPEITDDGWETGHIEEAVVKTTPLLSLMESIINNRVENIHGLLLVKNGKLVLEEYFEGYGRKDLHLVASVTKSVNSILFGQLMEMGLIKDLDQPAYDFFPEYDNPEDIEAKKNIKIRHLLTMTAGLDWDYLSLPIESAEYPTRRMMVSSDPIGFILSRKVAAPPGRIYNYNDGLSVMLGEIIRRTSNMPVGEFAESRLFGPLGIRNYAWTRTKSGITETQGGLYLRPRDMCKIGQLILNGGRWKNKQIVSSAWLRESTSKHVKGDRVGYGYQWRTADVVRCGRVLNIVWASGYGGQRIFIVPDLNVVVVVVSKVLYNPGGGFRAERLFVEYFLPALLRDKEATKRTSVPLSRPEELTGCYNTGRERETVCIELEGNVLYLNLKVMNYEEKCELKPISEAEIIAHSKRFGEIRIILKRTDEGELDGAVVQTGLRSVEVKEVIN